MQKKTRIILFFVITFGSILRIYELGRESLHIDEAATAIGSSLPSIPALIQYWFSVGHQSPYFLMMHYWIKLFGQSEFALRLPSAVFGVMSIYIMFLLARRLFNNEKTALLSSYLLAVSTINIYYSQCARPYSIVVFLVLMSFLFLLRALEKNTKPLWATYICFTLFSLLINTSTLPILICHLLFIVLFWTRYRSYIKPGRIALVFGLILLAYLPFLVMFIRPNIRYIDAAGRFSMLSLNTFMHHFNIFGGEIYQEIMYANPTRNPALIIPTNIFGIMLSMLCLAGVFNSLKARNRNRECKTVTLLTLWLAIPIVLPFIFSHLVAPVFGPVRYVLYVSCAYYLLIGKGVMSLKKNLRLLLLTFIVLMGLVSLQEYYRVEKRTNWKNIANYIEQNIKDDEKTFLEISYPVQISFIEHEMLYYYKAPSITGIRLDKSSKGMSNKKIHDLKWKPARVEWRDLEEIDTEGIWLVVWHSIAPALKSDTIKKLQDRYALLERNEFCDVSLLHFRIRGPKR